MRRLFIVLLLGLLAAVALVALIESSPGYVLVSWGRTTIETSLWVALLLLAVLFGLAWLLARFLRQLRQGGGSIASWLQLRRENKGRRLTEAGMLSFAGGNWERARRKLLRAVPHLADPTLNYLAAARASNKMQEPAQVRQYLDAALNISGASDTVALTRAELLLETGDAEAALADLESLHRRERRFPQALVLKQRAYLELQRWNELLQLLPQLAKQKLLSEKELAGLERRAHSALLESAIASQDAAALKAAWFHLPELLKRDAALLTHYVPALLAQGEQAEAEAEKLLKAALKREWSPALVEFYGRMEGPDPARRLKLAETWLKEHPEDATLLLCLGRLSLRGELWGRARDYFESSNRLSPSAEASAELARLLFNLGEREKSAQAYRQGLLMVESDLPRLPQPGSSR